MQLFVIARLHRIVAHYAFVATTQQIQEDKKASESLGKITNDVVATSYLGGLHLLRAISEWRFMNMVNLGYDDAVEQEMHALAYVVWLETKVRIESLGRDFEAGRKALNEIWNRVYNLVEMRPGYELKGEDFDAFDKTLQTIQNNALAELVEARLAAIIPDIFLNNPDGHIYKEVILGVDKVNIVSDGNRGLKIVKPNL